MSQRVRSAFTVLPIVMSLVLGLAWQASAQTPAPQTAAPATTPTTNALEGLVKQLLVPTTLPPPRPTVPVRAPVPTTVATKATVAATTTTTAPAASRVIPSQFIPIINSVRRSGPKTDAQLLDALQPLADLGLTGDEVAMTGYGHFPVAGAANWGDDWLEARFGPPFHLHQGTDIFAPRGTPVRAPFAGVVRYEDGGLGGKSAYVTVPGGTYYYMAHLDSYSKTFSGGAAVKQGDIVGYVGSTGDAAGGATHCHFEIHPNGGAAVNPKPILDGWLADAIGGAAALLAGNNVGVSRAITSAGALRLFQDDSPAASGRTVGPLLWASSVSAGGGTLRLAEIQVARLAGRIDWDRQSSVAQARADALRKDQDAAWAILGPLTPNILLPALRNAS
ncbi:MAG: M23 family metallopeptidase [Actinomycetota bacterium]|nr:M23 family metallopeptidase [Actinomycetota bacterium]